MIFLPEMVLAHVQTCQAQMIQVVYISLHSSYIIIVMKNTNIADCDFPEFEFLAKHLAHAQLSNTS